MKTRVISGLVGAAILILVLISDKLILNIGVALIAFIALMELYSSVGLTKKPALFILGFAASVAFTFAQALGNWLLQPVLYSFIALLFLLYMDKRNGLTLQDIATMFFITTYLCFFMGNIVFIRKMPQGEFFIWLLFICAFLTDTFALFAGKLFGKHKLCPELSPKKTVEGSIGGVAGSIVGVMVYCLILQFGFGLAPHYGSALGLAVTASVISQLGDLAASRVKRQFGIKDFGFIMPGHGGIMDRFDSVIFAAPFVYYYLSVLPIL